MKLHNNKLGSYVIKFINIASYVMLRASKTVIQKQSKWCTQKIVSTFGRKIINQVAVDSRQFSVTIVARHATSPECADLYVRIAVSKLAKANLCQSTQDQNW